MLAHSAFTCFGAPEIESVSAKTEKDLLDYFLISTSFFLVTVASESTAFDISFALTLQPRQPKSKANKIQRQRYPTKIQRQRYTTKQLYISNDVQHSGTIRRSVCVNLATGATGLHSITQRRNVDAEENVIYVPGEE